ncbi:MAG: ATP-binding protein [Alistipes onderdonkii]
MAQAKGIALVLEGRAGAGDEVMGDPFRIRQAADNLISNALKFTDEGSVTIRADVVEGRLVFSVRDTAGHRPRGERTHFPGVRTPAFGAGRRRVRSGVSIVDRLVNCSAAAFARKPPGRGQ